MTNGGWHFRNAPERRAVRANHHWSLKIGHWSIGHLIRGTHKYLRELSGRRRLLTAPSRCPLPWVPPVSLQVHPSIQEEPDALLFQEAALRAGVPDPKVRTARPALLDDPVAGNPGSIRGAVHGPPNDPGGPGRPENPGDLAIGGHPPRGNASNQGVDSGEEAVLRQPRSAGSPSRGPATQLLKRTHCLSPRQRLPDPLGSLLALRIVSDEINLLRPLGAKTKLGGASNLLLVEHPSTRDRRVPAVQP